MQLADAPMLEMDFLLVEPSFPKSAGAGRAADLEAYVAALRARGYDGIWSLEVFNDRFRASPASTTAVDGMRSLRYLDDQVARRLLLAQRLDAAAAGAVSRHRVRRVRRQRRTKWSRSARMFEALGFTLAGRHRSKRRHALESERHQLRHQQRAGELRARLRQTCMARRCVRWASASKMCRQRCSERRRCRSAASRNPSARASCTFPSVRGVGGSLLYFIQRGEEQRVWEHEFVAVASVGGARDAGLLRVDYVAQTMQYEEMLSWLLYYLSLFDVTKTDADGDRRSVRPGLQPGRGIVGSRVSHRAEQLGRRADAVVALPAWLHGRGRAAHRAADGRHLRDGATPCEEHGAQVLPIPANYYEDLQARFDLDRAVIERLAAQQHPLRPRGARASTSSCSLRAFAKRFFFEIVQRRNYTPTVRRTPPIRIAAQSRYRADSAAT